jgi:hypothetical protein
MYVNFGATARLAARGARARRLPAAGAAPTWLAGGVRPLTDHGLAARQHARAASLFSPATFKRHKAYNNFFRLRVETPKI